METEQKQASKSDLCESFRQSAIGFILIIFATLKLPFLAQQTSTFTNKELVCRHLNEICQLNFCWDLCENITQSLSVFSVSMAGLCIILVFSIPAIVQSFSPNADCSKKDFNCE